MKVLWKYFSHREVMILSGAIIKLREWHTETAKQIVQNWWDNKTRSQNQIWEKHFPSQSLMADEWFWISRKLFHRYFNLFFCFEVTLYLQKSYIDYTASSFVPFLHLPLMIASYTTMVCLSKLRSKHSTKILIKQ